MASQLPYAVRQRIEIVFEVLSHLPLEQPVAVVSDAGKTIALNAPLLELLGGASGDLLGRHWSGVMPGWPDRARASAAKASRSSRNISGGPTASRSGCASRSGRSPIAASPARWPTAVHQQAGRRDHRSRRGPPPAQEPAAAGRYADRFRRRGRPRRRDDVREPVVLPRRRRVQRRSSWAASSRRGCAPTPRRRRGLTGRGPQAAVQRRDEGAPRRRAGQAARPGRSTPSSATVSWAWTWWGVWRPRSGPRRQRRGRQPAARGAPSAPPAPGIRAWRRSRALDDAGAGRPGRLHGAGQGGGRRGRRRVRALQRHARRCRGDGGGLAPAAARQAAVKPSALLT